MASKPPIVEGSQPAPAPVEKGSGTGRNTLLAALVGLMALACVLLAMLLVQPAAAPRPSSTVTVTAAAPAQGGQAGAPTTQGVSFDAKGFGPLGDLSRHDANDALALGKPDAPVTLVEYADYACPFCAVWARSTQKELVQKYVDAGVLRIEWRDLVIFGEKSQRAAQAARAAGRQGKFWEYHETLFAASPTNGHPDLTDDALKGFAQKVGLDLARFAKDMDDPAVVAEVKKDTAQAMGFGANSTPVFAINGAPLVGAQPAQEFTRVIEAAQQAMAKVKNG